MIRHIVLIRPRTDLAAGRMDVILAALRALRQDIAGIVAVEAGRNVSPEGLAQGFDHAFTVDFLDAAARDAYLPHPAHQRVGAMIVEAARGGLDGVLVADLEM